MATHDRDVVAALQELIIELKDELDAVLLTGDIATTSANAALVEACTWLRTTGAMAGNKLTIALAGNHDRFHPFPSYAPGAVAFEAHVGAVPTIQLAAPVHGVGAVHLDKHCLLVSVDLTLRDPTEATSRAGRLAQGIVRRATDVTDAIGAARTSHTTHIVVATHFPLDPLDPAIASHECIGGSALRDELRQLAETLPVLLMSGHLHQESHYRNGNLFTVVGATASQALHPARARFYRPANLAAPGAHAAFTVRTEPGGFVVTRWRYGDDVALGRTPPAKRFCQPTELPF